MNGALAASLMMFGLAAGQCLLILFKLLAVRLYSAVVMVAEPDNAVESFKPQRDIFTDTLTSHTVRLIWLLSVGILLAAADVFVSLWAR
jgi:hypothetical protein